MSANSVGVSGVLNAKKLALLDGVEDDTAGDKRADGLETWINLIPDMEKFIALFPRKNE